MKSSPSNVTHIITNLAFATRLGVFLFIFSICEPLFHWNLGIIGVVIEDEMVLDFVNNLIIDASRATPTTLQLDNSDHSDLDNAEQRMNDKLGKLTYPYPEWLFVVGSATESVVRHGLASALVRAPVSLQRSNATVHKRRRCS
jgi:hypothetical protein